MNAVTLRRAKLCALLAATALAAFPAAVPASAQTAAKQDALPADHYATSPGGVDMRTGQFTYSHTDLSMGGATGMALVRDNGTNDVFTSKPFGNFAHNWEIFVNEKVSGATYDGDIGQIPERTYHISVTAAGRSSSFSTQVLSGSPAIASAGAYARLEHVGSGSSRYYKFTAGDGTVIQFRPIEGGDCQYGKRVGKCAYASFAQQPDGTRYDFAYDAMPGAAGVRLRRVTSNLGYALILEYSGAAGQQRLVSKACVLNLAVTAAPATNVCPSGARSASYTYLGNGHLASYTGPDNAVFRFGSTWVSGSYNYEYQTQFFNPGETSPYLTNLIARADFYEATKKQIFADGRTFDYEWQRVDHNDTSAEVAGGSYRRNGAAKGVGVYYGTFHWPKQDGVTVGPGPNTVTDELDRTTKGDYCYQHISGYQCVVGPLKSWTLPEGNSIHYSYDAYRNVTETRRKVKTGTTGNDIVTTAGGFDCSSPLLCAKPGWTQDARGNRTTYEYSPVHGGVTKETGPAVGGVQPQKRYFYEQRTATLAGGASTGAPVWLLVRESICKTGAASGNGCAVAGDEVATTYDYSPTNLQLRSKVVDAGGLNLRTCYGYDAFGNKISETTPRGGCQ